MMTTTTSAFAATTQTSEPFLTHLLSLLSSYNNNAENISPYNGQIDSQQEAVLKEIELMRSRITTTNTVFPNKLPTQPADNNTGTTRCLACGRTIPITAVPDTATMSPIFTSETEELHHLRQELQLLKDQVQDVTRVCNAVARGDFRQKITLPVQGVTMVQLKDAIDTMVDKLGMFSDYVTWVVEDLVEPGLMHPPALDVEGTWRELIGLINKLAFHFTSLVRSIAKVTKAVALGDLSQQIGVDAEGEMLDMKVTVNGMVERLQALAAEVIRVTSEVGSQGILVGQAHVPDAEGVWLELVENVSLTQSGLPPIVAQKRH